MLAGMRTTANSFLMKALLLLLVGAFALWGVGDVVRSGGQGHLAKVGSETVNYADFVRNVSFLQQTMQAMGLNAVDRGALEEETLRRMIEEKMVLQRMREIGLSPDEALLAERVREAPMFQDVTGKFDAQKYHAMLAQRRMSEPVFLSDLKADIRNAAFTASLGVDDLNPPAALAALLDASSREERSVALVRIAAASVKADTPDEDALKSYYDSKKELYYMAPETRSIEYVTFTQKDLAPLIDKQVSEAAMKERYDAEKDRFEGKDFAAAKPEIEKELRAEASENVVNDLSTAIEDALAAGDSMGEAIAKAGVNASSRMLKDITAVQYANKTGLEADVAAQGFSLEEGDTSNLETAKDGTYYMLSVKETKPSTPLPFAQVKADVAKRAQAAERASAMRMKAQEVKTALKADDWKDGLSKEGFSARELGNVRRSETSRLPAQLAQAVFEHPVGDVAGPLVQENGDVLMAKVLDISPAKAPEAGKAAIDPKTVEQMRSDMLRDYYQAMSKRYPVTINQALVKQMRAQDDPS